MSEILKVLNRKSVELKSEVIELGLADEMKKGISKGTQILGDIKKEAKIVASLKAQIASLSKIIESKYKEANSFVDKHTLIMQDISSTSRDLGINPNEIKGFDKYESLLDDIFKESDILVKDFKTLK